MEHVLGEGRVRWPDIPNRLHLYDTRGLAVANALAGLRMGVGRFDTTIGGLGGCPFAGQPGAAGNICKEELALLCAEMGITTDVDLDALIEIARLAGTIVGHPLPSELLRAATVVMALQTHALGLNLWRLIAGIGLGMEFVTIDSYLAALVPRHMRGRAFVINQSVQYSAVPAVL